MLGLYVVAHVFLLETSLVFFPAPRPQPAPHIVVVALLTEGQEGIILTYWPLQQLKGRVLVKGKKLPAARSEDGRILSDQEEEDEEEEEEAEAAEQRRRVSGAGWASLAWAGKGCVGRGRTGLVGEGGLEPHPRLKLISQAKQISPELSALAVYCCATRLRTLLPNPVPPQPCQVSSLSERKAKKLIREAGRSLGPGVSGGRRRCRGFWWGVS